MPRVDDYFPFRCGDVVREKDGRHNYKVRAIYFNTVLATSIDNGWKAEFLWGDIEKTPACDL